MNKDVEISYICNSSDIDINSEEIKGYVNEAVEYLDKENLSFTTYEADEYIVFAVREIYEDDSQGIRVIVTNKYAEILYENI